MGQDSRAGMCGVVAAMEGRWSGVHQLAPEVSDAMSGSFDHILLLTDTFVCEAAM